MTRHLKNRYAGASSRMRAQQAKSRLQETRRGRGRRGREDRTPWWCAPLRGPKDSPNSESG